MAEQTELTADAYAFMRQEHDRIIDAYHDPRVQRNELIKFHLAFASIPVAIVAILLSSYRYLEDNPQLDAVLGALRSASVYLSILLVFVGGCVLMVMLKIRGEQYLYVKTINGTRKFFKDNRKIAEVYLVLPSEINDITFGEQEPRGRAFWEAIIFTRNARWVG